MPPFSEAGLAVILITSFSITIINFMSVEQRSHFTCSSGRTWLFLVSALIPLGMMKQLKHELLLLHNKVNPFIIWGWSIIFSGEDSPVIDF